ncbi:tocopherol cyclase [Asimina triloba]
MELDASSLHPRLQSSSLDSPRFCFGSRLAPVQLGFPSRRHFLTACSTSVGGRHGSVSTKKDRRVSTAEREVSVKPFYKPTPPNRNLRTPHSG